MADHSDWIYLGSGPDCEIRIPHAGVSAHHARCRLEVGDKVLIEDLGSPGGTAINRPGNRIVVQYVAPSDTLYLSGRPLTAATVYEALRSRRALPKTAPTPAALSSPASQGAGQENRQLQVEPGVTVIGRDPDVTNKQRIVLPGPMVSRNHAGVLRAGDGEYYIWDLGSTYGTFVDSRRVGSRRTRIAPHAVVEIPGFRFFIGAQGATTMAPLNQGGAVHAEGISAGVGRVWNRRLILDGVRFSIAPRSMVALMGASGAGKTTLLTVMAGQSPPVSGKVYYDNLDLFAHFSRIRASLGYVPQDDILHPQLTVRQALFFSARLRLPVDYSSAEIRKRVEETMDKLGIAGQADVPIGSAVKRGISGGQRKRVNLAMELIPDPTVLLLDEPTSGLSSADAERVVRTLRDLTNDGRTVIVTIHQPSRQVFEMFDQLLVLDNDTVRTIPAPPPQPGRLIFNGPARRAPAYFQDHDASGNSRALSGAEVVFAAIESNPARKTEEWEKRFIESPYFSKDDRKPYAQLAPGAQSGETSEDRRSLPSPFHQFSTLLRRVWQIKASDRWSLCQAIFLQPLVVAIGIALASGTLLTARRYVGAEYVKDFLRIGKTLFFGIFTALWFGCNNTAREIVAEIAVYRRERFVGLSLSAYLGSKIVFFSGICAVQCLVLAGVVSLGSDLRASTGIIALLFWLAALCGVAIGLLISALAPEGERAIQLVPLALLPMILFGGGLTRLSDLESPIARRIAAVVPARWAFEGALLAENQARPVTVNFNAPGAQSGYTAKPVPDRYSIVHHYFQASPHNDQRILTCAGNLIVFALIFVGLAGLALRLRDLH
jgi:ABC-type multidrug transport system ATPase subunit/pSer/pThr/pTyr-binding forkhead associated (FHA) protein